MIKVSVCKNRGRLYLRWRIKGHQETEYLNLPDTRDNRRLAKKAREDKQLALGQAPPQSKPVSASEPKQELKQDATPTLGAWMAQWIADMRLQSKGTRYDYELLLKNQIEPFAIAAMPVNEILPVHVQQWLNEAVAAGGETPSIRRINMALARIKQAFHWAVLNQKQTRVMVNPAPTNVIKALPEETEEITPFTAAELERIYEHAKAGTERALIMTLAETGLRPSEALALEREHVDLEAGKIRVRAGRTRWGRSGLKTKASRRDVDLTPRLRNELKRYLGANIGGREIFRFHSHGGHPLSWANFARRQWTSVLKRAGLEYRPPRQLRHTYATLKIRETHGDFHYVKEQLGHTNLEMIIRHYGSWFPPAKRPSLVVVE